MRWLVIFALLLPVSVGAQTSKRSKSKPQTSTATQPEAWPIESIRVQGNRNYTAEQILAVCGLKVGQAATRQAFHDAYDKLLATGLFENIDYHYEPAPDQKGYAATFIVAEVQPVYPFRFEGLPATPTALAEMLQQKNPLFASRIPATKELLGHYVKQIEEYLGGKVKVAGKLTSDPSGGLVVAFRPDVPLPNVAEVYFKGNVSISSTTLQRLIAGTAIGTPYTEQRFRQILDLGVRRLFEQKGLIRVAFPKIETKTAEKVNGLVVTVTVVEGNRYKLGDVRLLGPGLPTASLFRQAKFKTGETANFDEIDAGKERMLAAIRRLGYIRVKADVQRVINDQAKIVNLNIRITPGPQFFLGKLNIEGLDINGAAEVRRIWSLQEGKPFNSEYPDYFLARVRQDGLFDNLKSTRFVVKVNDDTHAVDVTLYFH